MKTLRMMIDEAFDQKTAIAAEPVIKKYADRAVQDKSPDAAILQSVLREIQAAKTAPQQQQQTSTTAQSVQAQ